jgi:hypothetical protein
LLALFPLNACTTTGGFEYNTLLYNKYESDVIVVGFNDFQ